MRLRYRTRRELKPVAPFHFAGTVHKPSHFPAPTEVFEDSVFFFPMRLCDRVFGIRLSAGRRGKRHIAMRIYAEQALTHEEAIKLDEEVRYRFAMDKDISAFLKIAEHDSILKPVASRWKGMRPSCAFSLYELLCVTILLQNTQISRSIKMLKSLLMKYGDHVTFAGKRLFAFWPPRLLASSNIDDLRALKLGYRARPLIKVSEFFAAHPGFEFEIRKVPKEVAAKQLRRIYGVGPATAWYLLFESLKHFDAFDLVSPWEAKILSRLIFSKSAVPASEIVSEARRRWGQWRMLAVHYLFEDLFWRHGKNPVRWLADLMRG
jgi:3-methyladenine DNA glycosylase/8-oxoguanine DNA glycosylase